MKKYLLIIALALFTLPLHTHAARLFTTGFEESSTTIETPDVTTPVSIVTSTARSGTYAARVNASNGFFRQSVFTSNQTTTGSNCSGVNIVSSVNASTQLIRWSNTANTQVGNITLKTDDTLVLLASNGSQIGSASAALTHNTWYFVCLKNNASASPGTLTGSIDGSNFATGNNSNQGSWAKALIGTVTGSQTTSDILFDDWKINDSSGSSETAEPGTGKLLILRPNAAGDSNQWLDTSGSAGTTNNYTLVDEVPPNDATDLVKSGTLNNSDFYNLDDTTAIGTVGASIKVVQVGGRFNNDTADVTTAFKFQAEKTGSGTVASSTPIIPNSVTWRTNTTAAPDTYPLTMYNDPDGSAWTQSTINTMQIGVKITAANVNKVQVSAIWAYVDYVAGTTPSARRIFPGIAR